MTNPVPAEFSPFFDGLLRPLLAELPLNPAAYAAWFDALSQRDPHLLVIQGLHSQVGNGGFAQWIENGYLERDLAPLRLALVRFAPTDDRAISVLNLVNLAADQAHDSDGGHLSEEVQGDLDLLDDGYSAGSDAFEAAFQSYFTAWA